MFVVGQGAVGMTLLFGIAGPWAKVTCWNTASFVVRLILATHYVGR
jgi:hypothetical protein